jgi:flavodoxin
MKACVIFYSYSGITRSIARNIQKTCGADLIEVQPKETYTSITAYTIGCMRARREQGDPVAPEEIDVSSYDLLVIGGPVWAWKPAPPVNGAIKAVKGCDNKKAVLFATCGSQIGETLAIMKKAVETRGVSVIGEFSFTRKEVNDDKKLKELIDFISNSSKT